VTKRSRKKERLLHWKVIIDTNVLISGFWKNPSQQVLKLWKQGKVQLLVSEEIVDEYLDVLSRFLPQSLIKRWEIWFTHPKKVTLIHSFLPQFEEVRDKTDNKFLEAAVIGGAKYLISRDSDLIDLGKFHQVEIVTPEDFIEIFRKS
jgi:putative PIN family toxin of toxin-antitoxin system